MLVSKRKDIANLYRQIYSILQLDKHQKKHAKKQKQQTQTQQTTKQTTKTTKKRA